MADKKIVGGGEDVRIYRLKADGTAVVQSDGTTTATTNAHATLQLTTGLIKPTLDIAGGKLTLNTVKVDDLVMDFLDTYIDENATTDSPEILRGEAGTEHKSSTSSSADKFVIVYKGGSNADGILTFGVIATLDPSSANFEAEYNKHSVTNLVFNLVKAELALAIVNGLLPTPADYNGSATFTIALDRTHWKGFLAAA